MYLFGHLQGHTQQRAIHRYIATHWGAWFPALPSYQACNRRWNQLVPAFELALTMWLTPAQGTVAAGADRLLDSVPIMLAHGVRARRARVAADQSSIGFCATKQQYYYGVKLHLLAVRRAGHLPLPAQFWLAPAAQHDVAVARQGSYLLPPQVGVFADKAYDDATLAQQLWAQGNYLVASYKQRRNDPPAAVPTLYNRFVSHIRQPIESFFGWLIRTTKLQDAAHVRSSQGLLLHCYGKLAVACLLLIFYS